MNNREKNRDWVLPTSRLVFLSELIFANMYAFCFPYGKVILANNISSEVLLWGVEAKYQPVPVPVLSPAQHHHLPLQGLLLFAWRVRPWDTCFSSAFLSLILARTLWLSSAQQGRGNRSERPSDSPRATEPSPWRLNLALFGSKVSLVLTAGQCCLARKKCQHMVSESLKISSSKPSPIFFLKLFFPQREMGLTLFLLALNLI